MPNIRRLSQASSSGSMAVAVALSIEGGHEAGARRGVRGVRHRTAEVQGHGVGRDLRRGHEAQGAVGVPEHLRTTHRQVPGVRRPRAGRARRRRSCGTRRRGRVRCGRAGAGRRTRRSRRESSSDRVRTCRRRAVGVRAAEQRGGTPCTRHAPTLRGMAGSQFTLAALATTAVPGLLVTGTRTLGSAAAGDYESALLRDADGTEIVIRRPRNQRAEARQSADLVAIRALSAGIRTRLPFGVAEYRGQAPIGSTRAIVTTRPGRDRTRPSRRSSSVPTSPRASAVPSPRSTSCRRASSPTPGCPRSRRSRCSAPQSR